MPYYRVLALLTPSITGEEGTHDVLSMLVDAHNVTNVDATALDCIREFYSYCDDAPITIAQVSFDDLKRMPKELPGMEGSSSGRCWLLEYKTGCGWDWSMVTWASNCPTFDAFRLFPLCPSTSGTARSAGNVGRCWKVQR